jgi:uncharacterized protein with HEPN domain
MSNNSLRDKQYLLDILNAAQIALQYIEGITREQFSKIFNYKMSSSGA